MTPGTSRITLCLLLAAAPVFAQAKPDPRNPAEIAKADRDKALDLLTKASFGDDPFLRSNAIEALQVEPNRVLPLIQRGFADPAANVRFAAVVSAGQLDMKNLAPAIRGLVDDENLSVRAAAIFALHTLGEKIDITPLAGLLDRPNPGLRANVALLLGQLGDASAIPMLRRASARRMPRVSIETTAIVRIQIAEALAELGDDDALDAIRAGLFSQYGEVQIIAILALGRAGDQRGGPALVGFLDRSEVEVRLAAAASIARLGPEPMRKIAEAQIRNARQKGTPVAPGETRLVERLAKLGQAELSRIAVKETTHARPAVRSQAASVLALLDDTASERALRKLMGDASEQVRVAAAAGVIQRQARTAGDG